jgi:hypothetical protein
MFSEERRAARRFSKTRELGNVFLRNESGEIVFQEKES